MNTVFEFDNYKAFLSSYLRQKPGRGHGLKSKWAQAMGCNVAYVSQVLNHEAHFSVEQSVNLLELLGLGESEEKFFLLLVQWARAGSVKLKNRIANEVQQIQQQRTLLRNRVDIKQRLTVEHQAQYYSSWHYAAVHMGTTIKALRTKSALAERFQISERRVSEVLDFLIKIGLVVVEDGQYVPGESRIFLGSDSHLISKHHSNWRLKAMQSLEEVRDDSLHLSTVITLSGSELKMVREEILAAIEKARSIVRQTTNEEDIACLSVDLFRL